MSKKKYSKLREYCKGLLGSVALGLPIAGAILGWNGNKSNANDTGLEGRVNQGVVDTRAVEQGEYRTDSGEDIETVAETYVEDRGEEMTQESEGTQERVQGSVGNDEPENPGINYTEQDLRDMTNILYAEAANQTSDARKGVARVILNRVNDGDYPGNIHDVIYQRNAFSCVNGNGSNMWRQAIGETERNPYDEMIYQRCEDNAESILNGEIIGIPNEFDIVAYHDNSINKPDKPYWDTLDFIGNIDDLSFYEEN